MQELELLLMHQLQWKWDDGVLINSAIALAKNPVRMAEAFKYAVISGRMSYLSGRMKKNNFASASSPKKV